MAGTFDTFYSLSSREDQFIRLFVTQILSHIKGGNWEGTKESENGVLIMIGIQKR